MAFTDTDNLSYISKTYELELQEKARLMLSADSTNATLEEINAKLNKLIKDINEKYDFVRNKVFGPSGANEFVAASHRDIDAMSLDNSNFVSENIKRTKSHPSINAFKETRAQSAYKTYDFINKTIELDHNTPALKFDNSLSGEDEQVHDFRIFLKNDEKLKIVEFSFTYRQQPNNVVIANGTAFKEPSVAVVRVIHGKFFVIRHDPVLHPEDILIKAIIENSDNTGNIINEEIVDVKSSIEAQSTVTRTDIGPEFDMFFKVNNDNTISIALGRITPYKWMVERTYINTENIETNAFSLANPGISTVSVDKVMYSKSANTYFVVDTKAGLIYTTQDENFNVAELRAFTHLGYTPDIELINVGSITLICNGMTTLAFMNDVNNFKDLGFIVKEAVYASTREVLLNVVSKVVVLDPETFLTYDVETFNPVVTKPEVQTATKIFEKENGWLMMLSATENNLFYQIVKSDSVQNTYKTPEYKSNAAFYVVNRAVGWDAEKVELDAVTAVCGGIAVLLKYTKNNARFSTVIHFDEMESTGLDIEFKKIFVLDYYNTVTADLSTYNGFIKKLVSTSLFDFGLTDENKLVILDIRHIIDALTLTKEYQDVTTTNDAGATITNRVMVGYTDKHSILYMEPTENESEYYESDDVFLNNVIDIVETSAGIFIIDKHGVYEVMNNKNLKTRFYPEGGFIDNHVQAVGTNSDHGFVFCKDDAGETTVFKQSYNVHDISSQKLRYKYTDLYNSDWQKFSGIDKEYDTSKKIIEFTGTLYVSLVDRMSGLYNTSEMNNMVYTTGTLYGSLDPNKDHKEMFNVNDTQTEINVPVTKFVVTVNKYGIINYYGFTMKETPAKVSDINVLKSFIMVHKPDDGNTLEDYRQAILQKLREEAVKNTASETVVKTYQLDTKSEKNKQRTVLRVERPTPFASDGTGKQSKIVAFAGFDIEYFYNDKVYLYTVGVKNSPNKFALINKNVRGLFATDIGLFACVVEGSACNLYFIDREKIVAAFNTGSPITNFGTAVQTNVTAVYDIVHHVTELDDVICCIYRSAGETTNRMVAWKMRDINGTYTMFTPERRLDVLRPDLVATGDANRSRVTDMKSDGNTLYFWNSEEESGVFKFNANAIGVWADTVIARNYIDIYRIRDVYKVPGEDNKYIVAVDGRNSPAQSIVVYKDNILSILARSDKNNGCFHYFIQNGDLLYIGGRDKVFVIDTTNLNIVKEINLSGNIGGVDYSVVVYNGEVFAVPYYSKISSIFRLDGRNATAEDIPFGTGSAGQQWITGASVLPEGRGMMVSTIQKNTAAGTYNQHIWQYVSMNPERMTVKEYAPIVMSSNKSTENPSADDNTKVDNIGFDAANDWIIKNFERSGEGSKIDKIFFNQPLYTIDTSGVPQGTWNAGVFTPDKEYYAINGDLTKWSVYKVPASSNKFPVGITLYTFVPNNNVTHEPVNKSLAKIPLEGMVYYTKTSNGLYTIENNLTEFAANREYYRRSGTWHLVNSVIDTFDPNAVYYVSEDVKYQKVEVSATWNAALGANSPKEFDIAGLTGAINTMNGNTNNEQLNINTLITNDRYEIYARTTTRTDVRQSFANSPANKTSRFVNGFCMDSNGVLLIPTLVHEAVTANLTGKDPYGTGGALLTGANMDALNTPVWKSVIYDTKTANYDICSFNRLAGEQSPYSVYPIYRVFDTSVGKFAVYKQDYPNRNGERLSMGLITEDYKQIISVLFDNVLSSADDVNVFEYKTDNNESIVFISSAANNVIKIYDKTARKLSDTPNFGVLRISDMFVDWRNRLFALDAGTANSAIVYKYNVEESKFEIFWTNDSTYNPFQILPGTGFTKRPGKDDLTDVYLFGNGSYNAYKFDDTTFVPVLTNYSVSHTRFEKVAVDADNNFIVQIGTTTPVMNAMKGSIIVDLDDNVEIWEGSGGWDSATTGNDFVMPNKLFVNNSNQFVGRSFDVSEDALEQNENNRTLVELPEVSCLPLEIDGGLMFNHAMGNELDCTEDPDKKFVAYYEDGIAVRNPHMHFDSMTETTKGVFGVSNNEIFLNEIENNSNGFVKVGQGMVGSTFRTIKETKHGIFYVDNKNVMLFNVDSKSFDMVTQHLATNANTMKINFFGDFDEGIVIASKTTRIQTPITDGVVEISEKAALHVYNPKTKVFTDVFQDAPFTTYNHITDITETNLGLMVVVNKTSNILSNTAAAVTIESYKAANVNADVHLVFNDGIKLAHIRIPVMNGEDVFDPIQVFEDDHKNIFSSGHAWYHKIKDGDDTVPSRWYLARKSSDLKNSANVSAIYQWERFIDDPAAESTVKFGQIYVGRTPWCGYSDGSEELIHTSHGIFALRTSRSLQYGVNINSAHISNTNDKNQTPVSIGGAMSYPTPMLFKMISQEVDDKFTSYGTAYPAIGMDYESVNSYVHDHEIENDVFLLNYTDFVKLVETKTKRLFIFKYHRAETTGNPYVDIYEYDASAGSFVNLPNSRVYDTNHNSLGSTGTDCGYSPDYIKDFEILDHNGVLFFKLFNNRVFRYGNYELKWSSTDNEDAYKNEVLYDLKIVFENPDKYNNLPEDTSNSEIDKFVVKEVGVVNPFIDTENNKETDIFRNITQFFMPHNYYNHASGMLFKEPMELNEDSPKPKEFFLVENVKHLYRDVYKGLKTRNLINSRFIKPGQDIVSDSFVHKTDRVLGDMEDYLQCTDKFRLEFHVYPTNCANATYENERTTVKFGDIDSEEYETTGHEIDRSNRKISYVEQSIMNDSIIIVQRIIEDYEDGVVVNRVVDDKRMCEIVDIDEFNIDDDNLTYNYTVNYRDVVDGKTIEVAGTKVFTGRITMELTVGTTYNTIINYNFRTLFYNSSDKRFVMKERNSMDLREYFGFEKDAEGLKKVANLLYYNKKARSKCLVGDYLILNSYTWVRSDNITTFVVPTPKYVVADKMEQGIIFIPSDTHSDASNSNPTWQTLVLNNMKETWLLPILQTQLGLTPKTWTRKADIPHLRNEKVFFPTIYNIFGTYTGTNGTQRETERYAGEKHWSLFNFNLDSDPNTSGATRKYFRRAPWSDRNSSEGYFDDWWLATYNQANDRATSVTHPERSDFGYIDADPVGYVGNGCRPCFML